MKKLPKSPGKFEQLVGHIFNTSTLRKRKAVPTVLTDKDAQLCIDEKTTQVTRKIWAISWPHIQYVNPEKEKSRSYRTYWQRCAVRRAVTQGKTIFWPFHENGCRDKSSKEAAKTHCEKWNKHILLIAFLMRSKFWNQVHLWIIAKSQVWGRASLQ